MKTAMELYKTVIKEAGVQQVIERSRFIAHVKPVGSREEADAFIAGIRERYKDATHNVPAIVQGDKFQVQWASDDGEPQGTSGAPIVQMLVKEGITNVAVVVTRYFGGIKLGTGGLVRAYTGCAKAAVEAAQICGVYEMSSMEVKIGYNFLPKIKNLAADEITSDDVGSVFTIDNIKYGEKVTMDIITAHENESEIISLIGSVTSGSGEILGRSTIPVKVQK